MIKQGEMVRVINNSECGRNKDIPIGTICYVISSYNAEDEGDMVEIIPKDDLPYKGYGEYQYPICDVTKA